MFVILTYDVNSKRVSKALKICRKYLSHVQKSVFEGCLTEAKLKKLQYELQKVLVPEEDSVCVYRMDSAKYARKEQIGKVAERSHII